MTRRSNFTIDRNRNRRRLLQGSGALAGLAALGELPLRAFGSGRVETPYGGRDRRGRAHALVQMGPARSRLEPFKRLALIIKAHWHGILNAFDSRLNNGGVEPPTGSSRSPRPLPAAIAPRAT